MKMEDFFPYQLAVAAAHFSRRLEEVYRGEAGLSREEWRVLFLLADIETLTSKELSRRSSLDKVQISRAAQRLERKGLLSGRAASSDRRLRDYTCTDSGRALFRALLPRVDAQARQIFAKMTPEDMAALKKGVAALCIAAAPQKPGTENI
ncbi:MAG: MarR family winged helix-turn-helix transcriptional regulator [Pseudorhodobacter sp.]